MSVGAAALLFGGGKLAYNSTNTNISDQRTEAHGNMEDELLGIYSDEDDDMGDGDSGQDSGEITPEEMPLADVDNDGSISPTEREAWLNGLKNTSRGTDGFHISSYGQANDSTPDSNTMAQRGFANNRLSEGSVALSPDIYNRYKPPLGSAVYVNGNLIGYYEDRTPASYTNPKTGVTSYYGQTIDVYDPNNRIGPIMKNAGSGAQITFGPPRKQVSNP